MDTFAEILELKLKDVIQRCGLEELGFQESKIEKFDENHYRLVLKKDKYRFIQITLFEPSHYQNNFILDYYCSTKNKKIAQCGEKAKNDIKQLFEEGIKNNNNYRIKLIAGKINIEERNVIENLRKETWIEGGIALLGILSLFSMPFLTLFFFYIGGKELIRGSWLQGLMNINYGVAILSFGSLVYAGFKFVMSSHPKAAMEAKARIKTSGIGFGVSIIIGIIMLLMN